MIAEKQKKLAQIAVDNPEYRFSNLYDLLHWRPWIEEAARKVLSRKGSDTAGVDGKTRQHFMQNFEQNVENLRMELKRGTFEPMPTRRAYIPKGIKGKRPLGILTLNDRIVQEAMRMMLDPIFESDFHHDSYGFRKRRRTMDAVAPTRTLCNTKSKYYVVIEGDIKGYFDNIHQRKLMKLIKKRVADKKLLGLIWKFLKAGVMEGEIFKKTDEGVPQGGIISPLFANIYLNEFDWWCDERWNLSKPQQRARRSRAEGNFRMLRFADDFIVLSNGGMTQARTAKQEIKEFLWDELRIELSEEKTRITHINDGFDFLGFHVRRVKNHENRWVIHLRPSEKNKRKVKRRLKELTTRKWFWMDEYTRLNTLNSVVRGWSNYYQHTTLITDIEDIAYFAHMRYQYWLYKKHDRKTSKRQLYKTRTATYLNRNRWFATLEVDGKKKTVYQWKPTRAEYKRSVYIHRSEEQIGHPYLDPTDEDYPQWEGSPPIKDIRILPSKGKPFEMIERKAQAKLRDNYTCQRCGERLGNLEVHHIRGKKDCRLESLTTLCKDCHKSVTWAKD